jgi:hypothetical protein
VSFGGFRQSERTAVLTESLPSAERDSPETPAFFLGTRVWDDTSTTSYFHVVSSIEVARIR